VKPLAAWLPSQIGLELDSPQRHSAICGIVAISAPSQLQSLPGLVTR
jgi:hypothetical protein